MEPNRGASETTLRDGRDWSRAFAWTWHSVESWLSSHPPPKASINCILLVICCTRSKETVGQFASEIA